jgi:CRISP-associated protein Cas1
MLPALGIFHRNKYNAFCLADDVMEPYRPFVDRLVVESVGRWFEHQGQPMPEELTKELKTELLSIPVLDVEIEGMKSPLMIAAQRTTAGLMRCYESESRSIPYPQL